MQHQSRKDESLDFEGLELIQEKGKSKNHTLLLTIQNHDSEMIITHASSSRFGGWNGSTNLSE
jgi:hypothetical protein